MENDSLASLDILRDVYRMANFFMKQLRTPERESVEAIQATIFRVPDNIRRTNADSFEPKMVSLGPYHHGKQRFRATDGRIKLPNATNFFKRTIRMDMEIVERTVERFKEWEPHLRCVYSEQINMTSNEFVAMMMLDCTFVAEFLREQAAKWYGNGTQEKDYLWKWAAPSIVHDMLVAENQFPLGPLLYLFNQCTDDSLHHPPLTEFLCHDLMLQIHRNLSSPSTLASTSNVSSFKANSHLLHLFHGWLVSQLQRKEKHLDTVDLPSFPSAEVLEAMRIQFTNKTDGSSFLDITFDESKRSMEIPQLDHQR
ncbi:putative UPF0481 protein At3g02645 [Zingiber officinale]|uniref:Uncharacterized protein n=1 Tax=Zingiber officinale TaxID=94328 RepID=A0A8J5HRA9_ZINOF|nr:putative UPF0481 protein At3g02645 [Zingiber officinale]XP_042471852.1 putative UPF0481 protein At3g02645 [Zingiber officinale]KAG6522062.1 hypothetical protein ZIOFF_019196 [Zingiber officinale]